MTVRRERDKRRIYLGQGGYIEKILKRFAMGEANGVLTTIEGGMKFEKRKTYKMKTDKQRYQELVGSVNYAAVATKADIAFAVGL